MTWNDTFRIHIKQIFTNLELIKHSQHGSHENRQPMSSYEGMFQPKSKRILIEGKAGVGKSTLASEMVYDWATEVNNSSFKLVFLIELRQVNKGIKEAMFDLLFPRDFMVTPDQLYDYVTHHQEEVLFILDGYDEINPSLIPDLHDLIMGKFLKNSTVVVTTRPEKGSKLHWYVDLRVEVTGFTAENMYEFIHKYFQEDPKSAESLVRDLEMNPVAENIARLPLTALLICAMWEEMPHVEVLSTMTGLFVELTLCLVKRYYSKEKKENECNPEDISTLEDIPPKLYQSLLTLGEIAINGLLEDQVIFDRKFLEGKCGSREIFELGFLSLERSASRLRPKQQCRFLHRSYQEFLASLWLSDRIKKSFFDPLSYEETLVHVMKCVAAELMTVLFSFTPGLMGNAFEKFFDILISEGSQNALEEDMKQMFFSVCVQALYESQQGSLATMLSDEIVVKGTVKLNTSEPTPYGIRSLAYFMQNRLDVHTLIFEDSFLSKRNLATLARCLFEIKNLKELHLINSFAASGAMKVFTDNLSEKLPLEKLLVSRSKLLVKELPKVVNCCSRLHDIEINYSEISEENFRSLLQALKAVPYLTRICISREKIYHGDVQHFCSLLKSNSHLTHLELKKCIFYDINDVVVILKSLQHVFHKLTCLSLSGAIIKNKHKVDLGRQPIYDVLGKVLPSFKSLTHLDLSRNELTRWTDLKQCLGDLKLLRFLNISGNRIGDIGVAKLARVLCNLSEIEELHLAWNEITCEGAVSLAASLKYLTKLSVLSLKSNKIADKGAMEVFEALSNVSSIREILFKNNLMTTVAIISLLQYSVNMKNLECLNCKQNLFDELGVLTLVEALAFWPKLKQILIGCPVVRNDPMNEQDAAASESRAGNLPTNGGTEAELSGL